MYYGSVGANSVGCLIHSCEWGNPWEGNVIINLWFMTRRRTSAGEERSFCSSEAGIRRSFYHLDEVVLMFQYMSKEGKILGVILHIHMFLHILF